MQFFLKNKIFLILIFLLPACSDIFHKPSLKKNDSDLTWVKNRFYSDWRFLRNKCETSFIQNEFQRHFHNDTYLWFDEIEDVNPNDIPNVDDYFNLMKTFKKTSSGRPKDRYHWSIKTSDWNNLVNLGSEKGYGLRLSLIQASPPRKIVIAFVESNSPASEQNFKRGDEIISVDGLSIQDGDSSLINQALFPDTEETHTFVIRSVGAASDGSEDRTVELRSRSVTLNPLPVTRIFDDTDKKVGYLLINSFSIASVEEKLISSFKQFQTENIEELIIDLRYNGGGYTDIANELAFMIAGDYAKDKVFSRVRFNTKHKNWNPIIQESILPDYFYETARVFSQSRGESLPYLNLPKKRVFILTKSATASASEVLINALLGIDYEVVLIGEKTQGKPFGYYPIDNCGTTYFSIQFVTENSKGYGEFFDGFSPQYEGLEDKSSELDSPVKGCLVSENFKTNLGDKNELLIQVALSYLKTGNCLTAPVQQKQSQKYFYQFQNNDQVFNPKIMPGLIK